MSFLGVLRKIGHVFAVGVQDIAPFAPLIETIPGVGTVFGTVLTAITVAEQMINPANSGPQKKQLATAVVNAVHPGINQAALSSAIDGLVALLNQLTKAVAAMPPAPAVPVGAIPSAPGA